MVSSGTPRAIQVSSVAERCVIYRREEMADRPNVIVFFTDQQRWDASGLHGNPLDLMPNFDRMARQGTFLKNSVTCQPVCGPARACLQTGKYASTINVPTNGVGLPRDQKTLPTFFKEAGYQTGYIGKWHLADNRIPGAVPKEQRGGYDYWLASNVLEFTSHAYETVMFDNDDQPVTLPGYRVDALADATIRYIDEHKDRPFFLFTSYIEPHFQNHVDSFPAPDGYEEKYRSRWIPPDLMALGGTTHQHLAGYWGMIKRLDEAFGRVRDAVRSLGLEDNTIILFTTDHGCHFRTRNSEYKRSCHESSIRLPTALCGPGFQAGGELAQMTSLLDMPPTLLDAAGIEVPEDMQGRSIMPLIRKEEAQWPEEAFVQISEAQVGRAIRTERWKYCVVAPDKSTWVDGQRGSTMYVEQLLYDLQADPYELSNLIAFDAYDEIRAELRARLLRWMNEVGEAEPEIVLAETKGSGQRSEWPSAVSDLGYCFRRPAGKL
jgi:arylsulfatase A-like enzyme